MRPSFLLFLALVFLCQEGARAFPAVDHKLLVDYVSPIASHVDPYYDVDPKYLYDLLNVHAPMEEKAVEETPVDYGALGAKGHSVVFSTGVETETLVKTADQTLTAAEMAKKFQETYNQKDLHLKQYAGYEY